MITRCVISEEIASAVGVKPVTLERLGNTVVLAGPNGGGKTRYLNLIQQVAGKSNAVRTQIAQYRSQLLALTAAQEQQRPRLENKIEARKKQPEYERVILSNSSEAPVSIVRLTYPREAPQHETIANLTPGDLASRAQSARGEFSLSYKFMHSYLAAQAKALWDARHPDLATNATLQAQRDSALQFDKIFKTLLGRSLSEQHDGVVPQPTVGRRVFASPEFSEGEKLLVAWAITFFERQTALVGAVVLLDEPDIHLHGDACIQALTRLRDALGPHGQMFIATHSVPLIASIGLDSLYFVHDGGIEFASRNADRVVRSLLGGDEARSKLLEFLVDADKMAQNRFLLECLLPTGVADPAERDPQQLQFTDLVATRMAAGQPIRVLDYGCGKGRFAVALKDWLNGSGEVPNPSQLDYHAYNDEAYLDVRAHDACRRNVAALGLNPDLHVWTKMSALEAKHSEQFDLVVLCNVLHEIPPPDWMRVFNDVVRLLSHDGTLVVMEDLFPSVGELPNQTGFVILNEDALRKLCGNPDAIARVRKYQDRVMVAELSKAALRVTKETCVAALEKVKEQALEGLRTIRQKGSRTHSDGRAHAVWAMQFANATLALQ